MLPTALSPPWCIPGSSLSLLCTEATQAANKGNALATTLQGWERHSKATEAICPGETPRPSPRSAQAHAPKQLQTHFDYQFCLCDAEGKRLAAEGAGKFQDLIQHLLVKRWTVIMSLGRARDIQIALAGCFHPPATGYPIRQNTDFHPGYLI